MTYRSGVVTGVVATLLVAGAAGAGWWLLVRKSGGAEKSATPPIPASVPKPFKEDSATAVTLTAEAEAKLALKTGVVERKPMPRRRLYGGEVVIPPGRFIVVSAPLGGTLEAADPAKAAAMAVCGPLAATLPASPDAAPSAGKVVARGQPLLYLLPILDPVGRANLTAARVDAEGQVHNASEQLKLAVIAYNRAKDVLEGGAGSQRMVDEAQTQMEVARKALDAVTARRDILARASGDLESGTAAPIAVESPSDGVLRTVSALPGQTVAPGGALFEVINLDRVWVRVPVYAGEMPEIAADRPAEVASLSTRTGGAGWRLANPVSAPPAANPAAGTVDLFFALDNRRVPSAAVFGFAALAGRDTPRTPGERVGVQLPLREPAESLTVPWAAVVYDYHGGAWVYAKTGDRAYARQRVTVRYVLDATAVLADGPKPGTEVVTDGAAELFGTETGFSK